MNEENTYIVSDLKPPNKLGAIAETADTRVPVRLLNIIVDKNLIDYPNKIVRAENK
ncbi:MAG: hypothetical protein GXP23_12670 [Gammaproteobacteria bacterium]|nr:hypothetical protein [Gammaproteobacteria bacterium]